MALPISKRRVRQQPLTIGSTTIQPGTQETVEIPVTRLYTHTPVSLSLQVRHGRLSGPALFLSAAVHGDELNGVEIIRRVLLSPEVGRLHGTLIAVPVVNVFGFLNRSRYFPDRRDLNRVFPGALNGSLAARIAHLFLSEVVGRCSHGIDLHTGAIHRPNLPQIRATCCDGEIQEMAQAFHVPVILNTTLRRGTLRRAAMDMGVRVILYECGEALRFDELAIRAGVRGVLGVMRHLGMIRRRRRSAKTSVTSSISSQSTWLRAPASGVLRGAAQLGTQVSQNQTLGVISDPIGHEEVAVEAKGSGIIIGCSNLPVVNQGDALFHVAAVKNPDAIEEKVDIFHETLDDDRYAWGEGIMDGDDAPGLL